MGSASSRMSASPALIQPTTTTTASASIGKTSLSTRAADNVTLPQHDPLPPVEQSRPVSLPTHQITSRPDLKGKVREIEMEKEEGEISEEEERDDKSDVRIRGVDSWKPPSSSSIYRPSGAILPQKLRDSARREYASTTDQPAYAALTLPLPSPRRPLPTAASKSPPPLIQADERSASIGSTTTATSTTVESPPSDSLSLPIGKPCCYVSQCSSR